LASSDLLLAFEDDLLAAGPSAPPVSGDVWPKLALQVRASQDRDQDRWALVVEAPARLAAQAGPPSVRLRSDRGWSVILLPEDGRTRALVNPPVDFPLRARLTLRLRFPEAVYTMVVELPRHRRTGALGPELSGENLGMLLDAELVQDRS
jgi:hypothetical protein